MKRRLWHFHGGLRLPGHKAESMQEPIQTATLPERLTIPLQQHIGEPAEPVVEVGQRVLKGQMLARASEYISVPVHASTSGTIAAIEDRPIPHPSGLQAPCIVLDSDGQDEWIEHAPINDYTELESSALRNVIREAGIVGLGGAGFPAFIKLNPGPRNVVDTLILNGAECEPYITCDAMLMQEQPRKIIDGLLIMKHALQARRCIIALEDNKRNAHTLLVNALHEHESEFIEIIQIPTIYPTGGEKQLIKVLTGKEVPSHGLPLDIHMVCHNVGTAAAIADAIHEGKPLITRYVTVTGDAIGQPCNLEVRIGTPFEALLEQCGWRDDRNDEIIMGGPLMGFTVDNPAVPVIKTTNCILSWPTTKEQQTPMPCIRCGECARVCPAQLLPQQLYWYARAKNFDRVQDFNLFDCIECGCCAYVCPSHIPLVQYYRFAKTEIWAQERDKKKADQARERHEFRQQRIERKKQEEEERKRRKKEMLKKSQGDETGGEDSKKAAIEAAMARAKARRGEKNSPSGDKEDA
ncbi:electron transport complex subunit RsxC [Thiohalophilus sp.]|uniref:electron transport complex subunit RsxC n=1 Tax=Thiohalophilus sp. TaxID=3028392 RepID=UPI002ACDA9F8|nr:electron transport complex subunit RsxC [Thiohalophilus sp.]MDZ7663532.1 electron transport complex subunit RsxC [Thiohalophilus sp.]